MVVRMLSLPSHAIRYNMLVNPTGKPGVFRAPDWVQEHNNLKTKVLFGGSYANYTKKHVIDKSSLIDVYHSCHVNIERNFLLGGLTSRHTPPDLTRTYERLLEYMHTHRPNEITPGRISAYPIPDMILKGMSEVLTTDASAEVGDDDLEEELEDIDILGEI
jgi:hypothetical protein